MGRVPVARCGRVALRRAGTLAVTAAAAVLVSGLAGPPAAAGPRGNADPVVELGRRLFFDPAVSRSGDNSCASCHDPAHAFSSPKRLDVDDFSMTRRHSQTLLDAADGKRFHWDGEFDSVEDLVASRLGDDGAARPARARALLAALAADAGEASSDASKKPASPSSYGPPPTSSPPATPPTSPPPTSPPPTAPPTTDTPTATSSDPVTTEGDDEAVGGDEEVAASADVEADATTDAPPADASPAAPPPTTVAAARPADAESVSAAPAAAARPTPPTTASGDAARGVAARVERDGRYAEAFEAAFGTREVNVARVAEAVAAYVATIRSGTSDFDRFARGDATALSASAQRGLALFRGRAGCAACHTMTGPRPAFTDHEFHNTGIAARTAARRGAPAVTTGTTAGPGPETVVAASPDAGRALMSKARRDTGAFKTPTLRDVAVRPPYMHDGSFRTLEGVVRHYARGGFADPRLDPRVRAFAASDQDVADLAAFLRALSSDEPPGLAPDYRKRAARTELRFVDASGRPLVGLAVGLRPAGDRLPGDVPVASPSLDLRTDAEGRVAYAPGRRTHMELSLPAGVEVAQGTWVPDTCRALTLATSVVGRTTLLLALPADAPALAALGAYHEARPLTDAQRDALRAHAPATLAALRTGAATFTLAGRVELAGRAYARYEAWVPAGCAADAVVDVPLAERRVTASVKLVAGHETRIDALR